MVRIPTGSIPDPFRTMGAPFEVPRPPISNPAKGMQERLLKQIALFEKDLDQDTEVGATLVNAPSEGIFHIEKIGFWGLDMLILHGRNSHGRQIQLLQHYSQLNILLTALPKQSEKAHRIGFMSDSDSDGAAPLE